MKEITLINGMTVKDVEYLHALKKMSDERVVTELETLGISLSSMGRSVIKYKMNYKNIREFCEQEGAQLKIVLAPEIEYLNMDMIAVQSIMSRLGMVVLELNRRMEYNVSSD